MNWNNITYRQLKALREAMTNNNEEERSIAIMEIIFGDEVLELPLNQFVSKSKELAFLNEEIPNQLNVKNFTINGREYSFQGMLGNITTAQYIDFQNYLKNKDEEKSFSVFIIPKGHKYNDGYDMKQVFDDILDIPAPILLSASFFFNRQLSLFTRIFQHYSMNRLKKLKLPKKMKVSLMKLMESLNSSELSHMLLNSVK